MQRHRRQILRRYWHDEGLSNLLKTASGFALCLTEVTGWRIMRCYLLKAVNYTVEFVSFSTDRVPIEKIGGK